MGHDPSLYSHCTSEENFVCPVRFFSLLGFLKYSFFIFALILTYFLLLFVSIDLYISVSIGFVICDGLVNAEMVDR